MTHRLTTNCAKNYCNRTLIVIVIVENVVTCFLLGHGVVWLPTGLPVKVLHRFGGERSGDPENPRRRTVYRVA